MRRNARRLGALVIAFLVVFSPMQAGGPAVADEPPPAVENEVVLVPPDTKPTDAEIDDLAEEIVRNPMLQEVYVATEAFNLLPVPPLNTSVAFFYFSWMEDREKNGDLPDWVKDNYRTFLFNLAEEIREPSTTPKWKYPLRVRMLNSNDYFLDDLFKQLGMSPVDQYGDNHVLELATGSVTREGHSEDGMDDWMSRNLEAALLRTARTESQKAEVPDAVKVIKTESGAGIAGPRTLCNVCAKRVPAAGYNFPKGVFIGKFDKSRSPQSTITNGVLRDLSKKLPAAQEVWEKESIDDAVQKLGWPSPCQNENNASTMNLAAPARSAPCGEAENSLAEALSSQTYGGVDFSSLQLRYLSDDAGSGVKYAFSARAAEKGLEQDSRSGRSALIDSMAGLRTWLALSPDKFWVNLNPAEPDRIIDPQLGRTNAGRALLEADWQMKRTQGKLLDPKTEFGAEYWRKLGGATGEACYSSRMWIVPGKIEVHEDGSSLYVLKADLDVKAKAEQVSGLGRSACNTDPAYTARNERLEQEMVVPKIVKAVNTAPEYAPLRQTFLARVVAQWIRDRHAAGHTTSFDKLIDSGDLGTATTAGTWRPQEVYDRYVRSIRDGDFTYKRTTRVGNTIVTYTTTIGGVDFSKLDPTELSAADMDRQVPGLPQAVENSAERPAKASDGSIWLSDTAEAPPVSTWDRVSSFLGGRTGIMVVLLVALGVVLFFIRDGSALRRGPSG
ncbi:hypothetical protein [Streptomyces sp. NPDC054940]